MNLLYQTIALILGVLFVSWITTDADAKRYKYHRKQNKIIERATTALVVAKIGTKAIKQSHDQTND